MLRLRDLRIPLKLNLRYQTWRAGSIQNSMTSCHGSYPRYSTSLIWELSRLIEDSLADDLGSVLGGINYKERRTVDSTRRILSPEGPHVLQIPYASTRIYAGQSLLHTEPNQTCFNYESFLICHGSLCNENWAPRNKEQGRSSQRNTNRRGPPKHIQEVLFHTRRFRYSCIHLWLI